MPPPGSGPSTPGGGPLPQPSSGAPPAYGAAPPPPGYVAYGAPGLAMAPLEPTGGLRKATVVLFWVVVVLSFGLAAAFLSRKGAWDDFVDGRGSFTSLDDADTLVGGVAVLTLLAQLAALIVLSIWSLRVARNAQKLGVGGVKPGLACGGWYIPIGNLWVPWGHLRTAVTGLGGSATSLNRWHAAWIAVTVFNVLSNFVFDVEFDFDSSDVSSTLGNQAIVGGLQAVAVAFAALFAMRATRDIEEAVAARRTS